MSGEAAKSYIDRHGRIYSVLRIYPADGAQASFRAHYQIPDIDNPFFWARVKSVIAQDTFDKAQVDLDRFAAAAFLEEFNEEAYKPMHSGMREKKRKL